MIAPLHLDHEYDEHAWESERKPRLVRSERLFRATKQQRTSRQKLLDASRHGRRASGADHAAPRRSNKRCM